MVVTCHALLNPVFSYPLWEGGHKEQKFPPEGGLSGPSLGEGGTSVR